MPDQQAAKASAATPRAVAAWRELSERQRDLLRKAFDADQAAENHERQRARDQRGEAKALYPESRPASAWRWISPDRAAGGSGP